jgi:succinate-semialdehyde dehydrogenase / glutarate-semialdehyde dehydrogenase
MQPMSIPTPCRRRILSTNPTTGRVMEEFAPHSIEEVERRLHEAETAFEHYRRTSFAGRARWLVRVAELLEAEKEEFARNMTEEMGKPIRAAIQEAEKCALACRFYAENAVRFLAEEEVPAGGSGRTYVRFEPLGPVLAIMPWNFPFWQVFRFVAPALMAGNVGLLKHASNVPRCALAIEDLLLRAGLPPGVFQTLLIGSENVEAVIEDPRVQAVTLTGSVEAGSRVAALAGKAIKKTVLELGGSDPFVVMPSADLDRAVATAVRARTINNGQSCIAAKRFIVDRQVAEEFESRFVKQLAALKVGDPLDPANDIGPLATEDMLATLSNQVDLTVQQGARLLLGGKRLERPGYFYSPTALGNIPLDSPAYREELFGPVASVFRADGLEEALRIANDTEFGLGASIWTRDAHEQELFIEQIQSGLAFVNGMVASDPRLPFGGIKRSGYGRELSHHGIREFVNVKAVSIQ